jgi:hypothetical protein
MLHSPTEMLHHTFISMVNNGVINAPLWDDFCSVLYLCLAD